MLGDTTGLGMGAMGRQPGVGIVGVGAIGRLHMEAARRAGGRVVSAVASGPERARRLAAELDVPVTSDYATVLADPEIEVIHICTPNVLHDPMARAALQAGKHVICEKPLALTSHQAADLLRLAEAASVVHAVGFNNRFYPLVREARARVAVGDLGRVFAIRGFILEDSLVSSATHDWRLEPAVGGDSCAVATIGSHLFDLSSYVLDTPIVAVCADFTTVHPVRQRPARLNATTEPVPVTSTAEEVANILVRFASGAHGVLGVSQATSGRRYQITLGIDGTAAALAWDSEASNHLWIGHATRANEIMLADPVLLSPAARPYASSHGAYPDGFSATIERLVRAVYRRLRGDAPGPPDFPTFADGYAALLVHEAVVTSARTRAWVDVAPGPLAVPAVVDGQQLSATTGST